MSTNHTYVLHAREEHGETRHIVHLCEEMDSRIADVEYFLSQVSRALISTTHVMAVVAGPNHPAFKTALAELQLDWSYGCDQLIVDRAVEMLVASGMIPPYGVDDYALHSVLVASFSKDEDWEQLYRVAQHAALAFLLFHDVVPPEPEQSTTDRMLVTQLSAAICVAMVQARAEWSRAAREAAEQSG